MDCSTPGLPVHHQLPEFTQTHGHQVSDAIQPSHPLSSPSPHALSDGSRRESVLVSSRFWCLPAILVSLDLQMDQFSSVQSLSRVQLFATPWTAVHQASLSFTISQSLFKLKSMAFHLAIESLLIFAWEPGFIHPPRSLEPHC